MSHHSDNDVMSLYIILSCYTSERNPEKMKTTKEKETVIGDILLTKKNYNAKGLFQRWESVRF